MPSDKDRIDSIQAALYAQIVRRVAILEGMMPRIRMAHPVLADEFDAYAKLIGEDLGSLNIAGLWSVGHGLAEMVAYLTNVTDRTAPSIEPEALATLNSLINDHAVFIRGFPTGRELDDYGHPHARENETHRFALIPQWLQRVSGRIGGRVADDPRQTADEAAMLAQIDEILTRLDKEIPEAQRSMDDLLIRLRARAAA